MQTKTTIKVGSKIRVVVPIDPRDDRPIQDRREVRVSAVEGEDDIFIYEESGKVRKDRAGIDWELAEDKGGEVVVLKGSTMYLGTVFKVGAASVTALLHDDREVELPFTRINQTWGYKQGRDPKAVFDLLTVTDLAFDPPAAAKPDGYGDDAQPSAGGSKVRKPRKPRKPRESDPSPEPAQDAVSASEEPSFIVQRVFTFVERARLWSVAGTLMRAAESGVAIPDAIADAMVTIDEVIRSNDGNPG